MNRIGCLLLNRSANILCLIIKSQRMNGFSPSSYTGTYDDLMQTYTLHNAIFTTTLATDDDDIDVRALNVFTHRGPNTWYGNVSEYSEEQFESQFETIVQYSYIDVNDYIQPWY